MNYLKFFEKLEKADPRTKYDVLDEKSTKTKEGMPDFYKTINPLNIEFEFNDGIVRLASYEDLDTLKEEYNYVEDGFVFAICNGEPIYLKKNNKVYSCICGKNPIIEDELAESIEAMFEVAEELL